MFVALVAWLILFVLCWPLALLALILYPIVWLVLLPFRLAGFAVRVSRGFLMGIVTLPSRVLHDRLKGDASVPQH